MMPPDKIPPQRRYRWPWVFWGMMLLGIAISVVWMRLAVLKIERERDFSAPLPASAPR